MEEKNYEVGRVEISSKEYRDLVTEAVENARSASEARSEKWRVESERDAVKKELAAAKDEIETLKRELENFRSIFTSSSTGFPSISNYVNGFTTKEEKGE